MSLEDLIDPFKHSCKRSGLCWIYLLLFLILLVSAWN